MNKFFKDKITIEKLQDDPLGQYVAKCAEDLHAERYTRSSGRVMLEMVADFNRWLKSEHIATNPLDAKHVEKYLRFRNRSRPRRKIQGAALTRWLTLLRDRGVTKSVPRSITAVEKIVEQHDFYLERDRVFSAHTRNLSSIGFRFFGQRR